MKMRVVAVALSMLLAAAPAKAATYLLTVKGTVLSLTDPVGFFGEPAPGAGSEFQALFTLSYPTPGAVELNEATLSSYYGGPSFGTANPLSTFFSIGGVGFNAPGEYFGYFTKDISGRTGNDLSASVTGDGTRVSIHYSAPAFLNGLNLTTPFSSNNGFGEGQFELRLGGPNNQRYVSGNLFVSSVAFAEFTSPVPEPASWFMMVLGVGLIGASLRRRSVNVVAAQ